MKQFYPIPWILGKVFLMVGILLFTSSFQCYPEADPPGTGGGGTSGGGTGGGVHNTDMRNKCEEKLSLLMDLPLSQVHLRYDLSKYGAYGEFVPDFIELAAIHGPMYMLPGGEYVGEIQWLNDILFFRDNVADEERKPIIKVDFRDVECEGISYISPEIIITDCAQVSNNTLHGVPAYSSELAYLTLTAKSVKTTNSDLQIIWSKKTTNLSLNNIIIEIDGRASSSKDPFFDVKGVITSSVAEDELALRMDCRTGTGTVVEIGDYVFLEDDTLPVDEFQPIDNERERQPELDGPVFSGGDKDETIEWDAPVIYKKKP